MRCKDNKYGFQSIIATQKYPFMATLAIMQAIKIAPVAGGD